MVVMSGTALVLAFPAATTSAFLTARDVMALCSAMMLQMSTGAQAVTRTSSSVQGQADVFRVRRLVTKLWIVGMDQMRRTVHTENIFAGQTNSSVLMGGVFQQAGGVIGLVTVLRGRMNKTVSFNADLMSLLARTEDALNTEMCVMTLLTVRMVVMTPITATATCWESFPATLLATV